MLCSKDIQSFHKNMKSKIIFLAYFNSITKYGLIFWENLTDARKVFYTQRKIVRITAGA